MVVMIVLTAAWGLVQCTGLGSFTRSLRWRTLLLAGLAGAYAAAVVSVGVQWAWTRAFATVSGVPLNQVVSVAGYTLDPVIEELAKLAPLVLVWWLVASARRSWGYTDLVLLGAAAGTGFGTTENLLRFGGAAHRVIVSGPLGDWILSGGLFGTYLVPGPGTAVGQWVPAGVQVNSLLASSPTDAIDVHLVWTAVAGLGLGLILRDGAGLGAHRGRARALGIGLIAFAALDHVANNTIGQGGLAQTLGAPLGWLRQVIWAYPLAALAAAAVLDRRLLAQGRAQDDASLVAPHPDAAVLARLAMARPRISLPVVWGFVRDRRTVWTAAAVGSPPAAGFPTTGAGPTPAPDADQATALLRQRAALLGLAAGPDGDRIWDAVAAERARRREERRARIRQGRPRALAVGWALLLVGPFTYFVIGGVPQWSGVQAWLSSPPGVWLMLACAAGAMVRTGWRLRSAVLAWPGLRDVVPADVPASVVLGASTGVASLGIGLVALSLAVRGVSGTDPMVSNFHILDAINGTLLVGGLALIALALIADPPLAVLALAEGGTVLEMTGISAATLAQILAGSTAATVGGHNLAMSDGGDSRGGGGGDGAGAAPDQSLGVDPATGSFRPAEYETAVRVQQERGVELTRSTDPSVDWVDSQGKTYDAVGNFDAKYFDQQWPNLRARILDHLTKADYVPVDISRFTAEQAALVRQFVESLGPNVFVVG